MSSAIKLKCPSCGQHTPAKDINVFDLVAKCSNCGCIFPFKPRSFQPYTVSLKKPKKKPTNVSIHLQDKGKEILLTYQWRNGHYVLLLILAFLWNTSTIMWFALMLSNNAYLMAMLGMIYAFGGISLLYLGIAGFLNSTMIKIDDFRLTVTHQPILWLYTPELRRDDIVQLYCTLHINRGRTYTHYSYQLHAIVKNGKHICLLKGIEKAEQAQFLEQEIEKFLGIKDRYVKGEFFP